MAGYSGTPLAQKLGIDTGARVGLIGAPRGFEKTLGALPEGVLVRRDLRGNTRFDVMLFFTKRQRELARRFGALAGRIEENGGLWIAWPKKASGVQTDVTEAVVRSTGLDSGLVDNKICAIDEIWSGLRFVIRVVDRRRS